MKLIVRCIVPALCVAGLLGCTRRDVNEDRTYGAAPDMNGANPSGQTNQGDTTGQTTVTGATVPGKVASNSAIDRISAARCQREAACNNVGADKAYASQDVCMNQLRGQARDELKGDQCKQGVDPKDLDECVSEIQKASCGSTLAQIDDCEADDLCD